MRKIIVLIIGVTLIANGYSYSQISLPFPDSSGEWSETQIIYGGPGDPWYYSIGKFVVNGDTSIYNVSYKKLYWFQNCDSTTGAIIGFYRTDSMKVFYRDNLQTSLLPLVNLPYVQYMYNDTGEILLYDYSLQVGDTFYLQAGITDTVSLIDSVLLNGIYYKRINFSGPFTPSSWIEGIGSSLGFFPSYYYFENDLFFNCFEENNDTVVFNAPCFCGALGIKQITEEIPFTIVPNPFTFQTKISFLSPGKRTLRILSIQGIEIKCIVFNDKELILNKGYIKEGLYFFVIEDDKKYVVRKIIIK